MFDSEIEAFTEYCKRYPNNATLLVDTYDVLNSGIPNAIKAFETVLKPLGIKKCGIRIDSGDITYLSKKARKMLDAAGWEECKICISNSLDEYIIMDVLNQGAKIDTFGVGEKLITSKADPVFGGVYKLVAVEKNGEIVPKIKKSENIIKITNPGYKKVYRIYEEGKMIADLIALHDEVYDGKEPLTIFDEQQTWKKRTFTDYVIEEQHVVIFKDGKQVYELPSTEEVKEYCNKQYNLLWDEVTRFTNPHKYYVDLSEKLYNLKYKMLEDIKN
jgi:nicotinate phosphoribosyltransferase